MDKTGIIILAAGDSSRLGRPKQLLSYRGKTLLLHIISEALNASLHPVIVVTGAYEAEISDAIKDQPIESVHNPDWNEGMASGIIAGLSKTLSLDPTAGTAIIAVCDQPYISSGLLRALADKKAASGKGIIACAYSDTMGTPVLFERKYFKELAALSGNEGAKKLLKQHTDDLATIPFPQGPIDIDTEDDYQKLLTAPSQ